MPGANPANIRLGQKWLKVTNTLAYYGTYLIMVRMFVIACKIFAGKARSQPPHTCIYQTSTEVTESDKHSSLPWNIIYYG
jgi:hypothetical protein